MTSIAFVSPISTTGLSYRPRGTVIMPTRTPTFYAAQPLHRRSTIRLTPSMNQNDPSASKKPTAKELAKLYGASYFGTSVSMALVTFLMLYALVEIGVDVRALVNSFGDFLGTTPLGRPAVLDKIPDGVSAGLLAYLANKAISPIRFPLTIAATPFVARIFSGRSTSSSTEEAENST